MLITTIEMRLEWEVTSLEVKFHDPPSLSFSSPHPVPAISPAEGYEAEFRKIFLANFPSVSVFSM
jgi:hypothetical protein